MRALPPNCWGVRMKDWLVPPVLFPAFLILMILGFAILRTPT